LFGWAPIPSIVYRAVAVVRRFFLATMAFLRTKVISGCVSLNVGMPLQNAGDALNLQCRLGFARFGFMTLTGGAGCKSKRWEMRADGVSDVGRSQSASSCCLVVVATAPPRSFKLNRSTRDGARCGGDFCR
jgi:hypothetical protein